MIKSLSPNLYRKKSHPFVAIGIVTCAAHSSVPDMDSRVTCSTDRLIIEFNKNF